MKKPDPMLLPDFGFYLDSLSLEITQKFLSKNRSLSLPSVKGGGFTIFIHYLTGDIPLSFKAALTAFPQNVTLDQTNLTGNKFLAIWEDQDFLTLREFAKSQTCNKLLQAITEARSPKSYSVLKTNRINWEQPKPRVMAVLNITPDSFYDGGQHFKTQDYVSVAEQMIDEGADIIDIGGESTRPGSKPVDYKEEIKRIMAPLSQIRNKFSIAISVDTSKPEVAEWALDQGADLINDVSGLQAGEKMLQTVASHKAGYCLTHCLEPSETMQDNPNYQDVLAEVYRFFQEKTQLCREHGLQNEQILIDPGIGFGKNLDHNLTLLSFLQVFQGLPHALLLGTSNKSFIGKALDLPLSKRISASLATCVLGWQKGATVFRVHQVEDSRNALDMAFCLSQGENWSLG